MKNETKRVLRILSIGVLCSLLGYLLAGCDGEIGGADAFPGVDAGGNDVVAAADAGRADAGVTADERPRLGRSDAGMVTCAIPSPTGDAVNPETGRTAREDAFRAAEMLSYMAFEVVSNDGSIGQICSDSVAGGLTADAVCDSPATDFRGLEGAAHCFALVPGCKSSLDGAGQCEIFSLVTMDEGAPWPRRWALCGTSGVFVGWVCNE